MSPSHFAHRFRVIARMSPMRFVKEVRLDAARTLLLSEGARASDVALRVGYESPAHFARDFKRRFGARPQLRPAASLRARGAIRQWAQAPEEAVRWRALT